jgi:hypothetical protein
MKLASWRMSVEDNVEHQAPSLRGYGRRHPPQAFVIRIMAREKKQKI